MPIDPEKDPLIPLADVASLHENYATFYRKKLIRWHKWGIWSMAGKLVYLDMLSMGGRWFTTKKALQEFFEKCGDRV